MPAFSAYAPTPDLAQSFLGGVRLAQDAQQHAQQIQLQREKLAQAAQQAEMELMAKREAAQQQQLRQQQEMEIEKAYKQAQIGLRQREVDESAKVLEFKTQQAAQHAFIQQTAQQRIARGEDPVNVYQELGPQMGIGLPSGLFRPPTRELLKEPRLVDVGGRKAAEMQAGHFAFLPRDPRDPSEMTTETEVIPGTKARAEIPETTEGGFFGFGGHKFPAVPAVPATNARRITRHIPVAKARKSKPSQPAIDYLLDHPKTRDAFDAKYGSGMAENYLEE
jgi:hypothetical protein